MCRGRVDKPIHLHEKPPIGRLRGPRNDPMRPHKVLKTKGAVPALPLSPKGKEPLRRDHRPAPALTKGKSEIKQ